MSRSPLNDGHFSHRQSKYPNAQHVEHSPRMAPENSAATESQLVLKSNPPHQDQPTNPNVHVLEAIIRLANNEIGLDSRDNMLMARNGDEPVSLWTLMQQAAHNMGGTVNTILLIKRSELESLIRERNDAIAAKDQALADLGDLQARYNEDCEQGAEADWEGSNQAMKT